MMGKLSSPNTNTGLSMTMAATLLTSLLCSSSNNHLVATGFSVPFLHHHHPRSQRHGGISTNLCSAPATNNPPSDAVVEQAEDDWEMIRHETEVALQARGTSLGYRALVRLGEVCQRRKPFQFDDSVPEEGEDGRPIAKLDQLLPPTVTKELQTAVRRLEQKGFLSTNPDSVDGLPSCHLNLISGGVDIADPVAATDGDDFHQTIQTMTDLVRPFLFKKLLPQVQRMVNSTSTQIADVFLRRYHGSDMGDGLSRQTISAHYDVFSRITSVVALDNVAAGGQHGLFTTFSRQGPNGPETSNHAGLRRFFPLAAGDAVVHTWEVLHGVHVGPGLDRTSLIVWFTYDDSAMGDSVQDNQLSNPPSWLVTYPDLESNNIAQFVLATAIDSLESPPSHDAHRVPQLLLQSAAAGNTFALTRLGSMCEAGELAPSYCTEATAVLNGMTPPSRLPPCIRDDDIEPSLKLALRFWYEGSLRGNALAQQSLGDEVMFRAVSENDREGRILAATLFALAAQQELDAGMSSLQRAVQYEVNACGIETEEDFHNSPIVQIAQSALSSQV